MNYEENISVIRIVYDALGDLKNKVVFVGGVIVPLYADTQSIEARFTNDIDLYVAKSAENSRKVAAAIQEFFGEGIDEKLFEGNKVIVRMGIEPNQIEVSNYLSGLSNEEIIKHRLKSKFGDINTYYIGLKELIKNKNYW